MFALSRDWKRILYTPNDGVLSAMRIVLGAVMFAHGAQSALGWFGGPGLQRSIESFGQIGIPVPLAGLAISAELLGGIGLMLGLLARISALGVAINMLVAAFLVHFRYGFFMNWSGTKNGEGFEYHLLAVVIAAALMVRGAGACSLDRLITRTWEPARPAAIVSWPRVPETGAVFRWASFWMRTYWR